MATSGYIRRVIFYTIVFSVPIFTVHFLSAQTNDVEDLNNLSLEELLNVSVGVASKWEEPVLEAPSSVTVFTRREIQNMGVRNLEELLNYVPGFQATEDVSFGFGHHLYSRGHNNVATSNDILILVDGYRLNSQYNGGATLFNKLITLENAARVEVIRGPGSALYGANAFVGVVSIVTEEKTNEVKACAGELNAYGSTVNVSQQEGDYSFSAFLQYYSDEGYLYEDVFDRWGAYYQSSMDSATYQRYLDENNTSDPRTMTDVYVKLGYQNWYLHLGHSERNFKDYYEFGFLGNNVNEDNTSHSYATLGYNDGFASGITVNAGITYGIIKWDPLIMLIPDGLELIPGLAIDRGDFIAQPLVDYRTVQIDADISMPFLADNNTVLFGIAFEYFYQPTVIAQGNYDFENPTIYYGYHAKQATYLAQTDGAVFGIYVQDQLQLNEDLTVIAGVRLDHYRDVGTSVNPRTALIYSTPFNSKVKFMFGQAFRAPNLAQLYVNYGPFDRGNPDLQPEKIKTIELAYIQKLGNMQAGATYFYNIITDALDVRLINGLRVHYNSGEEHLAGLEFELSASPLNFLYLRAAFTSILKGRFSGGARNFGAFVANFNHGKWNLNLNTHFHLDIVDFPVQESWAVFNATLRYDFDDRLALGLIGKNVLDTEIFVPTEGGLGGSSPEENKLPVRGRQILAELRYKL